MIVEANVCVCVSAIWRFKLSCVLVSLGCSSVHVEFVVRLRPTDPHLEQSWKISLSRTSYTLASQHHLVHDELLSF